MRERGQEGQEGWPAWKGHGRRDVEKGVMGLVVVRRGGDEVSKLTRWWMERERSWRQNYLTGLTDANQYKS